MTMRPVLPSLIAGSGSAPGMSRPHLNFVNNRMMEQGVESNARAASAFAGVASDFAKARERDAKLLQQEQEYAALQKAQADYDRDVAVGAENLFKREGFSAAGITDEFSGLSRDAMQKAMGTLEKFSPKTMEQFRLHVQGRETSYGPRVSRQEHGHLQKAAIGLKQGLLQQDMKVYADTGDPENLKSIDRNFTEMWVAGGRRIVTPESLVEFDKDADAGIFRFRGETLRITDADESTPGTISRAKVNDLRGRLADDQLAFIEARQDYVDAAHAARLDAYLERGQVSAAAQYLEQNAGDGIGLSISPESLSILGAKVGRHAEAQIVTETANTLAMYALSEGIRADEKNRSMGGRYNTPYLAGKKMEAIKYLQDNVAAASPDKRPLAQRTLETFIRLTDSQESIREGNYKADLGKWHAEFNDKGLYLSGKEADLLEEISKMPGSPVKDTLLEGAAKRLHAANKAAQEAREKEAALKAREDKAALEAREKLTSAIRSTPEGRANDDAILVSMQRALAAGEKWNDIDLSDPAARQHAVRNIAGLPPEAEARLELYNSNRRVPLDILSRSAATALNELNGFEPDEENRRVWFTERNVTAVIPGILTEVENLAKLDPKTDYSTKDGQKQLTGLLREVLIAHQRAEPGFWGVKDVAAPEFFAKAIDRNGEIIDRDYTQDEFDRMSMTPKQYRAYRKAIEEIKSRYLERPMAMTDPGEEEYTAEAVGKGYGVEERRGKAFLVPPKEHERREKEKTRRERISEQKYGKDGPRPASSYKDKMKDFESFMNIDPSILTRGDHGRF